MEGSASDSFTLMTSTMPSHHQEEPMQNKQHLNSSIFSLTLDEFRTKSGKNFDSINFDEFLSSVWGEENQSCTIPNQNEPTNSVPIPQSGKTLEEVWSDIQRSEMEQDTPTPVTNHEQTPLGEMTLEDFLVKAGVIRESPRPPPPPPPQRIPENYNFPGKNSCLDANMNVGAGQIMGYDLSVQPNSNVVSTHGPSIYQLYTQSGGPAPLPPPPTPQHSNFDIEKCNNSGSDGSEPSSKKAKHNMCDEAFDRRQRRMIKNRESAARSRARKQAYTAELEIELNQLKEDNTRLKLALATAERKLHEYEVKEKKQSMKMQRKGEKTKGVKIGSSLSW